MPLRHLSVSRRAGTRGDRRRVVRAARPGATVRTGGWRAEGTCGTPSSIRSRSACRAGTLLGAPYLEAAGRSRKSVLLVPPEQSTRGRPGQSFSGTTTRLRGMAATAPAIRAGEAASLLGGSKFVIGLVDGDHDVSGSSGLVRREQPICSLSTFTRPAKPSPSSPARSWRSALCPSCRGSGRVYQRAGRSEEPRADRSREYHRH